MSLDANRVFANDGDANPAFWTVIPGHLFGEVVAVLTQDSVVQAAVQASLADPGDAKKRSFVIDHINRATVNRLGEHIVGQPLQPEKAVFTLYNLLEGGTALAIDSVIGSNANTNLTQAFSAKNPNSIIALISRQTGRALFQVCISQLESLALNPENIIGKLKTALLSKLGTVVPGLS